MGLKTLIQMFLAAVCLNVLASCEFSNSRKDGESKVQFTDEDLNQYKTLTSRGASELKMPIVAMCSDKYAEKNGIAANLKLAMKLVNEKNGKETKPIVVDLEDGFIGLKAYGVADGDYMAVLCDNLRLDECKAPSVATMKKYEAAFKSGECGSADSPEGIDPKCKSILFDDIETNVLGVVYPINVRKALWTSGDHTLVVIGGKRNKAKSDEAEKNPKSDFVRCENPKPIKAKAVLEGKAEENSSILVGDAETLEPDDPTLVCGLSPRERYSKCVDHPTCTQLACELRYLTDQEKVNFGNGCWDMKINVQDKASQQVQAARINGQGKLDQILNAGSGKNCDADKPGASDKDLPTSGDEDAAASAKCLPTDGSASDDAKPEGADKPKILNNSCQKVKISYDQIRKFNDEQKARTKQTQQKFGPQGASPDLSEQILVDMTKECKEKGKGMIGTANGHILASGDFTECDGVVERTGGCFAPETLIAMADGTEKRVDAIRKGDMVKNPLSGAAMRVIKVVAGGEPIPMLAIGFGTTTVALTTTHPVMTRRGVIQAKNVLRSDEIQDAKGVFHAVSKLDTLPLDLKQMVWNFEVDVGSTKFEDRLVLSNGIVTGELGLQQDLDRATATAAIIKK